MPGLTILSHHPSSNAELDHFLILIMPATMSEEIIVELTHSLF